MQQNRSLTTLNEQQKIQLKIVLWKFPVSECKIKYSRYIQMEKGSIFTTILIITENYIECKLAVRNA